LSRALIILAGGLSKRFGQDKCRKELASKPLIVHVLDRVGRLANKTVVVAGTAAQRDQLTSAIGTKAQIIVDGYDDHGPLVGALTGFESVNNGLALLLPCDAAFVSPEIAALLLDLCVGKNAAIPRWPDGKIEPLQAVYDVKSAASAGKTAMQEGKHDMLGMISHLRGIRYVSTLALKQYDPKLDTFLNINTVQDWKKAEHTLRRTR
jgi:molybdopterin-guanine dinucleotide biosynthesis protein A